MNSRLLKRALLVGLMLGAPAGAIMIDSHDYLFTVDPSQSQLTFAATVDFGLGPRTDSDTTAVTGTMAATLTPPFGSFTDIHLTDLVLDAVESPLHLEFRWQVLLNEIVWTVDVYDLGLRMGAGYGQAGPPTTVTAGAFDQPGNEIQPIGTVVYDTTLGSGSSNLADEPPFPTDLPGTVVDDGALVTLTLPVDLTMPLESDGTSLGQANITGQIVGTAPTVPEPMTLLICLTGAALWARRR